MGTKMPTSGVRLFGMFRYFSSASKAATVFAAACVLAAATCAAADGSTILLGQKYEGLAGKRRAFMERWAFPSVSCEDARNQSLDATVLLDRFLDAVGSDSIRSMTTTNILRVDADKSQAEMAWFGAPANKKARRASRSFKKFGSCAIVGNSGHLRASEFGKNIDMFDVVARGNQAPAKGYEKHVGSKTTARFLNEGISRRYRDAMTSALKKASRVCAQYASMVASHQYRVLIKAVNGRGGGLGRRLLGQEQQKAAADDHANSVPSGDRLLLTQREQADDTTSPAKGRMLIQLHTMMNKPMCRAGREAAVREGWISSDEIRFHPWRFPLEKGVVLAHISEFKALPKEYMDLVSNLRSLRQDVKPALVNYPVTFLAEQMLEKWADRLACLKPSSDRKRPKGLARPTTGFTTLLSLLPLCEKTVVYGFGPPSSNAPNATAYRYHFFKGMMNRTWKTTSKDVHNFRAEFLFIRSLAHKGVLTICNNASPKDCGLRDENPREEEGLHTESDAPTL